VFKKLKMTQAFISVLTYMLAGVAATCVLLWKSQTFMLAGCSRYMGVKVKAGDLHCLGWPFFMTFPVNLVQLQRDWLQFLTIGDVLPST